MSSDYLKTFSHNLFLDFIGRLVVERLDSLKNRKTLVISCCSRSIIVVLLLFTNVAAKTYFPIIPNDFHDVGFIGMKRAYFLHINYIIHMYKLYHTYVYICIFGVTTFNVGTFIFRANVKKIGNRIFITLRKYQH